jgi:DGQHR domain-containing protein
MTEIKGVIGKQNGKTLIVGVVKAKDIAWMMEKDILKVDIYSPSNPDGYQRILSPTRARNFGRYIKDGGVSPTSVLIYSRKPFSDGQVTQKEKGSFTINEDADSLYVADGQHRSRGFLEAINQGWLDVNIDYDVPVNILFWDPKKDDRDQRYEEATQFYVINTQAKRMRTDLAHEYIFKKMQKGTPISLQTKIPMNAKKKDYVSYAVFITRQLESDKNSPWNGFISQVNAENIKEPITEQSFTDSLQPVLAYSSARQANLTMEQTIGLLESYWKAIFSLVPEILKEPQEYVLMKTAGVYSLHSVLPMLLMRAKNLTSSAGEEDFKKVLTGSEIRDVFTEEFWASAGEAKQYAIGKVGFEQLAELIIERLEVEAEN